MSEKQRRMADPLWVRCCELWDKLEPYERDMIVKAMEYMVEKVAERSDCLGDEVGRGDGGYGEG